LRDLRPPLDRPAWRGESLDGRSILVYGEQGLGDIIQFARYVPVLAGKGAETGFYVTAKLVRILESLPGRVRVLPSLGADRNFDYQCPLMSLPYRLGAEAANIPATPYLSADPQRSARWGAAIGTGGFKIGVSWHGNPIAPERSFPLAELYPLSQIPRVRLISLQKNQGLEQLASLPAGMAVETLGEDFDAGPDAFLDTAAVMEHLDLVVTCDTAIAHLAGALARPVWVALKYVPDWRWMLERSDSPWYPGMRLFRQGEPGGWSALFEGMTAELKKLLET
jgi:hypothetical protein